MPRRHSAIIIIAALGLTSLPFARAANFTSGRNVKPFTDNLKPGDLWHPGISPVGHVVVFASLPDQVMYVCRNGVRIGRSTVSTGTTP